jgi:hypothetical protein
MSSIFTQNPKAPHVLVTSSQPTDEHLHVNTVHSNYKGFTKKQIQQACEAHCLMQMVAIPSKRAFQSMVHLNLSQNCPINHEDIKIAQDIYGADIANIRGKPCVANLNVLTPTTLRSLGLYNRFTPTSLSSQMLCLSTKFLSQYQPHVT